MEQCFTLATRFFSPIGGEATTLERREEIYDGAKVKVKRQKAKVEKGEAGARARVEGLMMSQNLTVILRARRGRAFAFLPVPSFSLLFLYSRKERAREGGDARDEVGAVGVAFDFGDDGGTDNDGVGVARNVGHLLGRGDAEADGDGEV